VALAYGCLLRYQEVIDVLAGRSFLERGSRGWLMHLTRSKTDPLQRGTRVLFKFRQVPRELHHLLDGLCDRARHWHPPSRPQWRRWLTALRPGTRFHGFRHGRVLDLIAQGVPKHVIMFIGRWRSLGGFGSYDCHK
jgi:hypothetical protein